VEGDEQMRLLAAVRAVMQTRTRDEWLALFSDLDVCLTPVNSVAEALADPHLAARTATTVHSGTTYLATPISIAASGAEHEWNAGRGVDIRPAPDLGAHTDDVLGEAGIEERERDRLRAGGII
jgi:alpha-methylacyl-CoA racemase